MTNLMQLYSGSFPTLQLRRAPRNQFNPDLYFHHDPVYTGNQLLKLKLVAQLVNIYLFRNCIWIMRSEKKCCLLLGSIALSKKLFIQAMTIQLLQYEFFGFIESFYRENTHAQCDIFHVGNLSQSFCLLQNNNNLLIKQSRQREKNLLSIHH